MSEEAEGGERTRTTTARQSLLGRTDILQICHFPRKVPHLVIYPEENTWAIQKLLWLKQTLSLNPNEISIHNYIIYISTQIWIQIYVHKYVFESIYPYLFIKKSIYPLINLYWSINISVTYYCLLIFNLYHLRINIYLLIFTCISSTSIIQIVCVTFLVSYIACVHMYTCGAHCGKASGIPQSCTILQINL